MKIPAAASLVLLAPPFASQSGAAQSASELLSDLDGDGRPDLYATSPQRADLFLRNAGELGFVDATEEAGLVGLASRQVLPEDFDRDGDLDLLLVGRDGGVRLLRAVLPGRFEDEPGFAPVAGGARAIRQAEWIDFDGDGWKDVYLDGGASLPLLVANRAGLAFEPVAVVATPRVEVAAGVEEAPEPAAAAEPERSGAVHHSVATTAGDDRGTRQPPGGETIGRTPVAVPTATGATAAPEARVPSSSLCAGTLHDHSGGPCLKASSTPTLGRLYPITPELFVDAATGFVGLGTTTPAVRLDVAGAAEFVGGNFDAAATGRSTTTPTNGYLGVSGRTDFDGVSSADWNGLEVGAAGISRDGGAADNYGLLGHSNGAGVRGEHSANRTVDYAELGLVGTGLEASGSAWAAELLGNVAVRDGDLRMFDSGGALTVDLDPEDIGGGSFEMFNGLGNTTVFLDSDWANTGYPQLWLSASTGSPRFILDAGVADGGANMTLFATDGSATLLLDGQAENSGGAVSVRNDLAEETVRLIGDPGDDSGRVVLFDREGANAFAGVTLDARDSVGTGGELLIAASNGTTTIDLDGQNGSAPQIALRETDGSLALQFLADDLNLYDSAGVATVNWDRQTGSKSAVVDAGDHGRRLVYVVESPEVWFEDFGRGRLSAGRARVALDPVFLETVTIDEDHPLHVFVTMAGPTSGFWIETDKASFEVRELPGGPGVANFHWRVVAKRRDLEDVRFELASEVIDAEDADGPERREPIRPRDEVDGPRQAPSAVLQTAGATAER